MGDHAVASSGGSSGFRSFQVVAKRPENHLITSFTLEPIDPAHWLPFEAGQYLVLKAPRPDGGKVLKHYSISSDPAARGQYRITVKRESAPSPEIADGIGSTWLHDTIAVGDQLSIAGPTGKFFLDPISRRPLVLLSGGVGLTPMVAMLHEAARHENRPVWFIHACRDGSVHAFHDEVTAVSACRPGINVHFIYETPSTEDRSVARHHSEGRIDRALLQSLLPLDDYEVYLCGPPAFMKASYATLRTLGIAQDRIAYEFFGPATILDADIEAVIAPSSMQVVAPPLVTPAPTDAPIVTFVRSGLSVAFDAKTGSLLDFAESVGLTPDFSCRSGVCGTCKVKILSGQTRNIETPLDEVNAGEILLCCCVPETEIQIDL